MCVCVCEYEEKDEAGLKVDCTEPFSPCKGLSAVSFCKWMLACEHGKPDYSQTDTFFFSGVVLDTGGGCYFIILLECVFLIKKMGKVMFRDGTKAASLSSPLLHPAIALCQRTLLSYACNLTHHLPRASSILIECFYLCLVHVITVCRTSEGCIDVSVCLRLSLCPGHKL